MRGHAKTTKAGPKSSSQIMQGPWRQRCTCRVETFVQQFLVVRPREKAGIRITEDVSAVAMRGGLQFFENRLRQRQPQHALIFSSFAADGQNAGVKIDFVPAQSAGFSSP